MSWQNPVSFAEAPFEIIDGDRGKNYPKQSEFSESGHCLFLSATNVTKTGFDFSTCQFIDQSKDAALNKGKLQREDIVLTTRGTIGNTAYFNNAVPFNHLRINSGMVIFRCDRSKLLPAFLYHFVRSPSFFSQVNGLRSGAAQPQLPIRDMRRITFPLPPLPAQHRIAAILSAYDDLIENNTRRIAILEEMARRIYEEWFVRFRFPGHEKVRMVESELGLVPEGWQSGTLADILENVRQATRPGEHLASRRYVPIDCIAKRSLVLPETRPIEEAQSSLVLFERDDILFGAMRPYFHKVAIAPCAGVTRTTCFVLRPRRQNMLSFATMAMFSDAVVAYASAHTQGATIPYAVWDGSLSNYKTVIPPDWLLNEFEKTVSPMLVWLRQAMFKQDNLRTTRDLLLPKLISGELDVSHLPEPEAMAA